LEKLTAAESASIYFQWFGAARRYQALKKNILERKDFTNMHIK
jgi:hypothetical protein